MSTIETPIEAFGQERLEPQEEREGFDQPERPVKDCDVPSVTVGNEQRANKSAIERPVEDLKQPVSQFDPRVDEWTSAIEGHRGTETTACRAEWDRRRAVPSAIERPIEELKRSTPLMVTV